MVSPYYRVAARLALALFAVTATGAVLASSSQAATSPMVTVNHAVTTKPLRDRFFVAPTARRLGDGSSWDNAASLQQLPTLVARTMPDGVVLLAGDLGSYAITAPITLTNGGVAGHPVTIEGATTTGAVSPLPEITGTRTSPYSPTGSPGTEAFRLMGGASHLRFVGLAFKNIGDGCFRFGDTIADVGIASVTATNVRRFVETLASGNAATASVTGLTVQHVDVRGFSKGAVRIGGGSSDVLLEDVFGDSQRQDGDNFAMGVSLDDTTHDVTLRRVTMSNSLDTIHAYWNGDGFAAEKGVHNLVFENTVANGNSDAGYDIKASNVTMTATSASGNKRNYRLWGTGTHLSAVRGNTPSQQGGTGTQTQVFLGPEAVVTLSSGAFTDSSPKTIVFELDGQAKLSLSQTVTINRNLAGRFSKVAPGAALFLTT
jgi:hypothetical protein